MPHEQIDGPGFEGRCCLTPIRELNSGVFFNGLQVLQRDLSVASVCAHVARAKPVASSSSLSIRPAASFSALLAAKRKRRRCGEIDAGPPREIRRNSTTGSPAQVRVLDAMCGGGVRAVRYALEVMLRVTIWRVRIIASLGKKRGNVHSRKRPLWRRCCV